MTTTTTTVKKGLLRALAGLCLAAAGCRVDPSLDAQPGAGTGGSDAISFAVPQGWPQPVYTFSQNPLTQEGFKLGRMLFYENRLSRDNSINCGSCHQQFAAFSQLDHDVSHGVEGRLGTRNSPGLANLAWHPALMWDGGVNNIEVQPLVPIEDHAEMDHKVSTVLAELSTDATYRAAFKAAFGSEEITSQRLFRALAQFMAAMVSANSRYDQYQRGDASAMNAQELRGLSAFTDKCASCHAGALLSDFSYRNNGLPAIRPDSGRARITGDAADLYRFKVPSLRNVDVSRPYMHDGRFVSLEAVLDHYRSGVAQTQNLDPQLAAGIPMTDAEKADIVAFLKTLTDTEFLRDPRFSEPAR